MPTAAAIVRHADEGAHIRSVEARLSAFTKTNARAIAGHPEGTAGAVAAGGGTHMHRTVATAALVLLVGCGGHTASTPAAPSSMPSTSPSPPAGPVNQVATFDLTFTADTMCTALPSSARSRTYTAEVVSGSQVISLRGGTFGSSSLPGYPSLWNVIYQNASADADTWWFQDPEIWERLSTESYVVIYGGPARIGLEMGTMNPQTGEWPFWGRFTYCAKVEPDGYPECEVPEVTCESTHHTLTLVRR